MTSATLLPGHRIENAETPIPIWLTLVLGLTVGVSFFVRIEPAPTDLMFVGMTCLLFTSQRFYLPRLDVICWLGITLFIVGDFLSLTQAHLDFPKALKFWAISFYLQISFVVYAGLLHRGGSQSLTVILRFYYIAAIAACLFSMLGLFNLVPGSLVYRDASNTRLTGTFKDPNVMAPFLVPACLIAMYNVLNRRKLLINVAMLLLLCFCVVASFSRAGLINLGVAVGSYFLLRCLATGDMRRFVTLSVVGLIGSVTLGLLAFLMLNYFGLLDVLKQRSTMQSYDVRRFQTFTSAFETFWSKPLGIGPAQSSIVFRKQVHCVYLGILSEGGIIAFAGFVLMLLSTIYRSLLLSIRSQCNREIYILIVACLLGQLVNCLVINSQHWRHFFLVLALPWGIYLSPIQQIPLSFSLKAASNSGDYR